MAARVKSDYGRLDRPVILDAALRITARQGTSELRFADLGRELGADPTAVYRHFRSKAQLMAALIERLMEEVADAVAKSATNASANSKANAPGHRSLLEAQAFAIFEIFQRHPAIGMHLADARPVGPNELAQAELSLSALEGAGLSGSNLIDLYGTISGYALSTVATSCWQIVGKGIANLEEVPWFPESATVTEETHPSLARNGEALAEMDFRSSYFAGIRVMLDLVDANLARAAGAPKK